MFLPFGVARPEAPSRPPSDGEPAEPAAAKGDLDALRKQLDEVQKRLDKMASKD